MIEHVGFFDEDFFAYCEDTDLGLRGRLAGWEAMLALEAVVLHKYSQTAGSFSPFKLYLVERNHYLAAAKSFPTSYLLRLPWFTLGRYLAQLLSVMRKTGAGAQYLASGSRTEMIKVLSRGIFDALMALPSVRHKRIQAMATRQVSSHAMAQLLKQYRMTFRELLDNAS